jgi:hypothetical protein
MTAWVADPEAGWIEHRGGIPWYRQRRPRRWHWCKPATRGLAHFGFPVLVERCACGSTRLAGTGPWIDRNSRRRHA